MDLTVDPADLEDDYGDESDANSTARQLEIDGGTAIPTPLQEAMHNERVPQQRRRKSKRSGR